MFRRAGVYAPATAEEKLLFFTAMARGADWGKDIPDLPRNGK
jgi:hypothetical protein